MKSHPAQFPLCRSKRSPSSSFRARQSGEPGRLAWQPGPWPAATPGRWPTWVLPNLLPPLCVFFLLSGSRKLGGHSGPHPSGSCCARGGCLPKGVSGELHAHRLRHRYLPFPALIWLHCLLFLGCFLFCPRLSGGSLSKQPVLASWVGCSAPECQARCCSCSPDSVHQGELMPHASRSCVRRADASLCELIITTNTAVYRALAALAASQGSAYRSLERQKSL